MGNRNSIINQVKNDYTACSPAETPTKLVTSLPQRVSQGENPTMCCANGDIYLCLSGQIYHFLAPADQCNWGPYTKLQMKYNGSANYRELYATDLKSDRGTAYFRSGCRQMLIDGDTLEIHPGTDLRIARQQPVAMVDYQLVSPYLDVLILHRIKSHTYSLIKAKVDSHDGKDIYYKVTFDEKIQLAQQFTSFDVTKNNQLMVLTSKSAITLVRMDQLSNRVYHELIILVDPVKAQILTVSETHYYVLTACDRTIYVFNVRITDGEISSEVETYEMDSRIYAMCLTEHEHPDLYVLAKTCINGLKLTSINLHLQKKDSRREH